MKAPNHFILRGSICALLVCSLLSFPLVASAGNNISVRVICNGAGVANADVKLYRVEANGDTSRDDAPVSEVVEVSADSRVAPR